MNDTCTQLKETTTLKQRAKNQKQERKEERKKKKKKRSKGRKTRKKEEKEGRNEKWIDGGIDAARIQKEDQSGNTCNQKYWVKYRKSNNETTVFEYSQDFISI